MPLIASRFANQRRVFDPILLKPLDPKLAGVAAAAGAAGGGVGVVAGGGEAVIDAEVETAADDLGFGEGDERGGDSQPLRDRKSVV